MTYTEVITQARQLPLQEQILLIETVLRWIREDVSQTVASAKPLAVTERRRAIPPASALLGIAKPNGPLPTDDELKEDYINYIERKYS